jgi:membrane-associated phospholipid phosphatase
MSALSLTMTILGVVAAAALLRLAVWLALRRIYACRAARFPVRRTGIVLLVLAVAYFGALFGGLIGPLIAAPAIADADRAVNEAFAAWRKEPLVLYVFLWITVLGTGPALTAVTATASAFLWVGGRGRMVVPLWVAFLGAQATTWIGKYAIGRERPPFIDSVTATAPSFPSGHATGSIAVFGFLAYLLVRERIAPRARLEIVYGLAFLVALIGFSRLVLSVHYLTDVIAGFAVGALWLVAGIALSERARHAE